MDAIAKHLPVKSEVDLSFTEMSGMKEGDIVHDGARNPFIVGDKELIPAKLFAVTQDIKVGDKCWFRHGDDWKETVVDEEDYIAFGKTGKFLKVLGPLSLDANWEIKDGDKIKIELIKMVDVEYLDANGAMIPIIVEEQYWECSKSTLTYPRKGFPKVKRFNKIKVLGPCGHYH